MRNSYLHGSGMWTNDLIAAAQVGTGAGVALLAKWTAFDLQSAGNAAPDMLNIPVGGSAWWSHVLVANPSEVMASGQAWIYISNGAAIQNNGVNVLFPATNIAQAEINNGNFRTTMTRNVVANMGGAPAATPGTVDVMLFGMILS